MRIGTTADDEKVRMRERMGKREDRKQTNERGGKDGKKQKREKERSVIEKEGEKKE